VLRQQRIPTTAINGCRRLSLYGWHNTHNPVLWIHVVAQTQATTPAATGHCSLRPLFGGSHHNLQFHDVRGQGPVTRLAGCAWCDLPASEIFGHREEPLRCPRPEYTRGALRTQAFECLVNALETPYYPNQNNRHIWGSEASVSIRSLPCVMFQQPNFPQRNR